MEKDIIQPLNVSIGSKGFLERQAKANALNQSSSNILDNINLNHALRLASKKAKGFDTEEAKEIYNDILLKFPQNKRAQKGLAALNQTTRMSANEDPPQEEVSTLKKLYHQGQLSNVVEKAKPLSMKYPNSLFVWNILGASQKGLGKSYDALKAFKKVISLNPNNPEGFSNLGVTLQEQGKLDEAIEAFEKALSIKPDYAEVYYNMGISLQELGKLQEAIEAYNKTLSIKPDYAQAHNNIGNALREQGRLEEAIEAYKKALTFNPNYAEAQINMGNALNGQGNFQEAIEAYKNAIIIKPNCSAAYNNIGVALQEQEKLEEAIEAYKNALSLKPDYAQAQNNIGNALRKLGRLEDAKDAYKNALSLMPNYAEAYYNLGLTFQEQEKLEEALEAYKNALLLMPDYAEAQNNMGNVLRKLGRLEDAIDAYKNALLLKPDYAEAYNNAGITLYEQGKLERAIEAYNNALLLKPDNVEAFKNIGIALRLVEFASPHPELQKSIGLLLDQKKSVRPKEIAKAVISLLKFEPNLQKHLAMLNVREKQQSLLETIVELSDMPLLLKLMSICPLADLELEALLKEIRAKILLEFHIVDNNPKILEFQKALSLQCFTNEYIYDRSADEEKAIDILEAKVKNSLALGQQPSLQAILCLASYKTLYEYTWHQSLDLSTTFKPVYTRQISEPILENNLKTKIPILDEIKDEISIKVREQYETHPYPRWVNISLPIKSEPISHIVTQSRIKLFDNKINKISNPNILVAGCGTGQHSIATAAKFKNSKVLGIDLSLSSLAYAKRKTEDLDINNIEYMHADILKLDKLNRQFDIVESSGVLHHMKNPMAGWKVLVNCLKDGGLMKIGLYSALARQHINEIRREILELEIGSSDEEMRLFRSNVINSGLSHYNLVLNYSDFYSLSTLRDLLFHTQEHQFTIPQIKKCLNELNLKFCGFENETIVKKFKASNSGEFDVYNLDDWQIYEEANPRTFAGMYQFWCQKMA